MVSLLDELMVRWAMSKEWEEEGSKNTDIETFFCNGFDWFKNWFVLVI
jgi:hypothetical protein